MGMGRMGAGVLLLALLASPARTQTAETWVSGIKHYGGLAVGLAMFAAGGLAALYLAPQALVVITPVLLPIPYLAHVFPYEMAVLLRAPEGTRALVLASTPGPGWRLSARHDVYARWPLIFGPLFVVETPWRLRAELAQHIQSLDEPADWLPVPAEDLGHSQASLRCCSPCL